MILPFTQKQSLTVSWLSEERKVWGNQPNVQVYLVDETGQLVLSDDQSGTRYTPGTIRIDFGGTSTGIVKIF